ncbi:MAG: TIGR02530 family flagellar biosynthesis protein [Lachnospiraceae bacterium]
MNIQRNGFLSLEQVQNTYLQKNSKHDKLNQKSINQSFDEILKNKIDNVSEEESTIGVKFSKHASNRLEMREIQLTKEQVTRLNEGTAMASAKGIKESLVMVDEFAFIVNIPNNTVVTAMEQSERSSNIFTNIDGAVIV